VVFGFPRKTKKDVLEERKDLRKFAPRLKRNRHIAALLRQLLLGSLLVVMTCLSPAYAQVTQPEAADSAAASPQGPQRKDVEIITTDLFHFSKFGPDSVAIRKLIGNVRLRQDSTYIDCDSAYQFLDTNLVIANGHVVITMPQSRTIKADHLIYNGGSKLLTLEKNVVLKDSSITLYTDRLLYYRDPNYGEYVTGGRLVQKDNVLTSRKGYYYPDRSMAYFKENVKLVNPDFTLTTDTLGYNTDTGIAFFLAPTTVEDSVNTMYTEDGYFDTENDFAFLHTNSRIGDTTYTLYADTIQYDQKKDLGKAIGHVRAEQKDSSLTLFGKYAQFQSKTERTLITDSTFAVQILDDDTLYLWADTLKTYTDTVTDKRFFFAYQHTRIHMRDMQGICDSLAYWYDDSLMFMYKDPVLYADESQITGDTIAILMKDGGIDSLSIPKNPFIMMKEDSIGYDQIKGGSLSAKFKEKDLEKMWIYENCESVYYTQDDGKEYIGMNRAKCRDMYIEFKDNKPNSILFKENPEGTFYPIYKVDKGNSRLEGYRWRDGDRPVKQAWMVARIIALYGRIDSIALDLARLDANLDVLNAQLEMLIGLAMPVVVDSAAPIDTLLVPDDSLGVIDTLSIDTLPGGDVFPIDTVQPGGKPKGPSAESAADRYNYQNAGNVKVQPKPVKERRSFKVWFKAFVKAIFRKPTKKAKEEKPDSNLKRRARQIARIKKKADREANHRLGRADKAYRKALRRVQAKHVRFFNPRRL
jgi:lipopolysaccharide export system protein LptA